MHPYVLLPLLSCIAAVAVASAILARDPGQRVNRLIALVLACSAYWSLCEVVANLADDAETAVRWIRATSIGWLWLAPLCLSICLETVGDGRTRLRRALPWAYAVTAIAIPFYAFTPWFLRGAVRTQWGWGILFGPLFPLPFAATLLCVNAVLYLLRGLFTGRTSRAERRQARWLLAGIVVPMTVSSLTDAVLPILGVQVPRLGSASLLMLGAAVAWSVRRDGYFLLAPGAFTQEIVQTLRDGVALLHAQGSVRFANQGLARLAGRSAQELRGVHARELLPLLGDQPCREIRDLDAELQTADGDVVPVMVSTALLRGENGRAIGCVLAVQDTRDLVALRNRLVTAGRLAAVGELAAGIAHEINNPVTFVRSNLVHLSQLWADLAEEAEKTEKVAATQQLDEVFAEGVELIEESVQGVDRIGAIVRDVSAFAHAGLGNSELADVNELMDTAANIAALRYSVSVERCYGDLPLVRCAPHQIRQLFINLLFNALQAVNDSGRIRLVTQALGDSVSIRVEDDGCGMSPDVEERIFDPFFTTRPAGAGTGLGLALAYQIVRNHGGEISVDSEPGRGSSFLIRLPVADAS